MTPAGISTAMPAAAPRSQAWTYRSITGIDRSSATVRPSGVSITRARSASRSTSRACTTVPRQNPAGVTFDKIAGTGHVRPGGLLALHDADPDLDRGREMTEQITNGPAGTRRWPLPVVFAEPGEDGGEEVESLIEEFSGSAAHRSPLIVWCSSLTDRHSPANSSRRAGSSSRLLVRETGRRSSVLAELIAVEHEALPAQQDLVPVDQDLLGGFGYGLLGCCL